MIILQDAGGNEIYTCDIPSWFDPSVVVILEYQGKYYCPYDVEISEDNEKEYFTFREEVIYHL